MTLAVTQNPAPHRYGGVLVDPDGWVTGFTGPGDPRVPLLFVGVQVAEAAVFEALPDEVRAASIGGVYDTLVAGPGGVAVYPVTGCFHDIGTPADYVETTRAVSAHEQHPAVSLGLRSRVHPSARVERSILWDDVTVGADCVVTDCILTDGVQLSYGITLDRQAVVRSPAEARPMPGATRLGDLLAIPI